jgi:hypothetical protein
MKQKPTYEIKKTAEIQRQIKKMYILSVCLEPEKASIGVVLMVRPLGRKRYTIA